jgi:hypothetical protein
MQTIGLRMLQRHALAANSGGLVVKLEVALSDVETPTTRKGSHTMAKKWPQVNIYHRQLEYGLTRRVEKDDN